MKTILDWTLPLHHYSRLRSVSFASQYFLFNQLARALGFPYPVNYRDPELLKVFKGEVDKLILEDIRRIKEGYYPASVLAPEHPKVLLKSLPKVFLDMFQIAQRRSGKKSKEFTKQAKQYFNNLPDYYLRNFHFQTDGYLSSRSAQVYDYEVELLFSGAGDAMRRLIIEPLKKRLPQSSGKNLKFLEIGAGTGRATKFIKLAFPDAKIVALDLSELYLKQAAQVLKKFKNLSFLQGDGAQLPFKDQEFDLVYSVFLFHELPRETRLQVLEESVRVLKPGGVLGFVDSLQVHDNPQMNRLLEDFPKNFHEPFYKNYTQTPMEDLFRQARAINLQFGTGFASKYGVADKASS